MGRSVGHLFAALCLSLALVTLGCGDDGTGPGPAPDGGDLADLEREDLLSLKDDLAGEADREPADDLGPDLTPPDVGPQPPDDVPQLPDGPVSDTHVPQLELTTWDDVPQPPDGPLSDTHVPQLELTTWDDVPSPPDDMPSQPDGPVPPEDLTPPIDVAVPPEDVAVPPEDGTTPPEDVVTPPEDVVTPPEDVVTPPEDVPAPPEDVVTPPEDVLSADVLPQADATPQSDVSDDGPADLNINDVTPDAGTIVEGECVDHPFAPCQPRSGNNGATLLRGTIMGPHSVICDGEVLISRASGLIECVGELGACEGHALADMAAIICADVVTPGLIDTHNHMTYNTLPVWQHGGPVFSDRSQWRGSVSDNMDAARISDDPVAYRYSELRLLMAGTTSVHKGSGDSATYDRVRNLERGEDGNDLGLPSTAIEECVDPLQGSCDRPDYINPDPTLRAYFAHLSEGYSLQAYEEFATFVDQGQLGPKTVIIHGVALDTGMLLRVAAERARMVWSPQSNIDLYGVTADLPTMRNIGIPIAIAPDWTPSGTMNLLAEVKCAAAVSQAYYDDLLSSEDLVRMVTSDAAVVSGLDDMLGSLTVGYVADVSAFQGDRQRPYDAVVAAEAVSVQAVFIGGVAYYGDASALSSDIEFNDFCEDIDVCGAAKRVCARDQGGDPPLPLNRTNYGQFDVQDHIDYLQAILDQKEASNLPPAEDLYLYDLYPLFACQSVHWCSLGNEHVSGEARPGDRDGDDVPDLEDNCPAVFNPSQSDFDQDGQGDSCDSCPQAPGEAACPWPTLDDPDVDGIPNDEDICPMAYDPGQEDSDQDGIGDACDPCPEDPNPDGQGCPVTIYDIKTGAVAVGMKVVIADALVTAAGTQGIFMQVAPGDPGYLGPEHSAIYAYYPSGSPRPVAGDRITIAASANNYYGQIQLTDVTLIQILSSHNPLPQPVLVDPAQVATGGDLAEAYEALLVEALDLTVTSIDPPLGAGDRDPINEFVVNGSLRVDDFLYLITPFPQVNDRFPSLSGVMRLGNGDFKLEPRGIEDLPVSLARLEPELSYINEGQAAVTTPPLTVRLTREAPADVAVDLTSSDPLILEVPAQVVVPQGAIEAEVTVTGLAAGTVTVTASLDGIAVQADVRVVGAAEVPRLVGVAPTEMILTPGSTAQATITLDLPARPGGEAVSVQAVPGVAVQVPAQVTVPEGQLSATFDVQGGVAEGQEVVQVALGGDMVEIAVEVMALVDGGLMLAEVFYDHSGGDDGYEWIKIYNGTGQTINLAGYSLGWGGENYAEWGKVQLEGSVGPYGCFVVGGTLADGENGMPVYDQAVNLNQDIQNSGDAGDGVALFNVTAPEITVDTVPIDAVVYGPNNGTGLIDETGVANPPEVGDAPSGSSIRRTSLTDWEINPQPSPNECPILQ